MNVDSTILSGVFRIVLLAAMAVYFFILIYLIKKDRMTLKYSLLWMLAGLAMLFIAVFPKVFLWAAKMIGVDVPSNALFAAIIFFLIVIVMFLTAVVSGQNNRITRLTQSLALLEKRVRDLESTVDSDDDSRDEETV